MTFLPGPYWADVARASESAGYYGVSIGDHLFRPFTLQSRYPGNEAGVPFWPTGTLWPDPWVVIAAMAMSTTRLHFTTNVYVAPARDLFTVAKGVATAATLAEGRLAAGFGVGWCREEFDQLGRPYTSRGARLDEMIPLLRRLWTGEVTAHHGHHYDFDDLVIAPVPFKPIPVFCGGDSSAALRRAVSLSDG